jgi:hypothetical protein
VADPGPHGERDNQRNETRTHVLLFVGGYLLFGLLLWLILDLYIAPRDSADKMSLIQALALIMAGGAGAIGIYFTWRGQRLTERAQEENQKNTQEQLSNAQEQLRIAQVVQEENQRNTQEELRLTREGQITERFTKAIDQLGSGSQETRLGGFTPSNESPRSPRKNTGPLWRS